jgi:hypothetical protein
MPQRGSTRWTKNLDPSSTKSQKLKYVTICPSLSFSRADFVAQTEHGQAEGRLQEERATLTRFDTELRDLDEVIKAKKQAAADADVSIKKVEHEVQALAKEKASHLTGATNLEKQYDWIAEESQ